jgi:hypothetical protein
MGISGPVYADVVELVVSAVSEAVARKRVQVRILSSALITA